MKKRKYQEGGAMPDIDREPLRDSQGNIVRSGIDTFTERFNINRGISPSDKGEPVMSGSTRDRGYEEAVALGKRMREERDAAAMDEAMLRRPSEQKTTVAPVKPSSETSPVRSEYDAQSGLDYVPGMGNRKPIAAAKAPVVTKEQMQKAGFNNLRDYLNAQQGLTRRGSPEAKPPVTSPPKKFSPTPIPVKEDVPTATLPKKAPKRQSMFTPKGENVPGMTRGMMKRPEGYAKGGSVGSASKRADGIAIRGKTRGKMV
jgi:hypothetical protein